MLKHIDKNTSFYSELTEIYSKYNIVLSESLFIIEDYQKINELKNIVNKLSSFEMETANFIKKVDSNIPYKKDLKSKEKYLNELRKQIAYITKNINVIKIKSKYKHFPARKRYTEFTGIDINFFKNIK